MTQAFRSLRSSVESSSSSIRGGDFEELDSLAGLAEYYPGLPIEIVPAVSFLFAYMMLL